MAYLNGNDIHGLFSPLVFAVKFVGSVAMMGAGMCLGVEAPMVHLGSCIASMASNADRRLWAVLSRKRWLMAVIAGRGAPLPKDEAGLQLVTAPFNPKDVDRREMISAGAAAGIAAAFGAPIGGVLFSLEEATSVWNSRVAWRCFVASAVAVFMGAQFNPFSERGLLSVSLQEMTPWGWLQELPLLAAVSVGGALLGAAFNKLRLALRPLRAKPKRHVARIREVVVVAALTVSTVAALSATVGRCLPVPEAWSDWPWVQHTCPDGQYNDLATLWLGPPVLSIRSLLSIGTEQEPLPAACTAGAPCYYSLASIAAMCAAYLPLFALSAALAIPGGLFMPSLLLGGVWGTLCGFALRAALPGWGIQPGLYTLCSATATLGGVFRTSISLAVLMVEATGSLRPMFGIIVAVVVSNLVAIVFGTQGVYESELEAQLQVNYLAQQPPRRLRRLTAEQVMSSPVDGLPCVVPAAAAQSLLRSSAHNGFPVYDPRHRDPQAGTFRLDGFIMRSQVELLLQQNVFCDQHGRYLHQPRSVEGFERQVAAAMAARLQHHPSGGPSLLRALAECAANGSSQPGLLTLAGGSAGSAALAEHPSPFDNQAVTPHINLAPYLNRAPATVRLETPATRVHAMFVSLSLRHISVVDERNYARGIITRRDLAHAAGSWLGRGSGGVQQDIANGLDSLLERPLLLASGAPV